jgi:hypothetical protein
VIRKGTLIEGQNNINVSTLLAGQYWLRLDEQFQTSMIPFIKQ